MAGSGEGVTLYLRKVPTALVRSAKVRAAQEGTTLTAVVIDALRGSLQGMGAAGPPQDDLAAERTWYRRNHAALLEEYRGQYVAIVAGAVLDHYGDFSKLAERVFERMRGGRPFATTPGRKLLSWFLAMQFVAISNGFARCASLEHLTRMFTVFGEVVSLGMS